MSTPLLVREQAFGASKEHLSEKLLRTSVIAASFGNALEWYDFSVYAFFASYIAATFFQQGDQTQAMIAAFVVFGA